MTWSHRSARGEAGCGRAHRKPRRDPRRPRPVSRAMLQRVTRRGQGSTDSSGDGTRELDSHIHAHIGSGHHGSQMQALPTAPQAAGSPAFRNTVLTPGGTAPGDVAPGASEDTVRVRVTGPAPQARALGSAQKRERGRRRPRGSGFGCFASFHTRTPITDTRCRRPGRHRKFA